MSTPAMMDLIGREKRVHFSRLRAGYAYYTIEGGGETWEFPVPLDDVGNATLHAEDRSLLFMRWLRRAVEDKTLVRHTP